MAYTISNLCVQNLDYCKCYRVHTQTKRKNSKNFTDFNLWWVLRLVNDFEYTTRETLIQFQLGINSKQQESKQLNFLVGNLKNLLHILLGLVQQQQLP